MTPLPKRLLKHAQKVCRFLGHHLEQRGKQRGSQGDANTVDVEKDSLQNWEDDEDDGIIMIDRTRQPLSKIRELFHAQGCDESWPAQ